MAFLFAGLHLIVYSMAGFNASQQQSELQDIYYAGQEADSLLEHRLKEIAKNQESISERQKLARFEPLLAINPDIIAWIKINNTSIDFPVVQCSDNDFYMIHDYKKNKNNNGAIFMDFRNSGYGEDRNTILYGHNMKNGKMFQDLTLFKNRTFAQQNRYIDFATLYSEHTYEIFSVYVTDTSFYYIATIFASDQAFSKFINELKHRSMHDLDTVVSSDDRILTLSTCSYEFENARLVLHAKLIN